MLTNANGFCRENLQKSSKKVAMNVIDIFQNFLNLKITLCR